MSLTLTSLLDLLLHLNLYIGSLLHHYQNLAYFLLMMVIFCETGLIVAVFLPGDSLLFATGIVFSAAGLSIVPIILLLILAAFLGDNCNYWIGRKLGRKLFQSYPSFFKPEYLTATEGFYLKYGIKAILLSRYLPFFRSFIPFFAGLSKMPYLVYLFFSLISASIWVNLLLLVSYFFGRLPFVQKHFSLVILLIIIASSIPTGIHFFKEHQSHSK